MSHCDKPTIVNLSGGGVVDVNNLEWTELSPEHCAEVFQCIIDSGNQVQFDAFCAAMGGILTVSTGPDGVVATAIDTADIECGGNLHFWSSDGSIEFQVTEGSAIVNATTKASLINIDNAGGIFQNSSNVEQALAELYNKINALPANTDSDVLTAVGTFTTTNGVSVDAGGWYIAVDNGETWAPNLSGTADANYANNDLTSDGNRTHSWNHSQTENFDGGSHQRNYEFSDIFGAGTHQITENISGRNVDLTGGPGQTSNENYTSSEYFREIENGASGSVVEQSGGEYLVTARDNNNSTAGTGDLQVSESRSALEYTETALLHNNGAPATTGFEAASEQVAGDQEPEPHLYVKTNNVSDGSATAGQVLQLIDPATGRVEYVDAAGGSVNAVDLISGEEGNTLRLGDDGFLYADPANDTNCYLEPVQIGNNGNTRNVGPNFAGLTVSDIIDGAPFSGLVQAENITTVQATIDNTGSGSLVVTNQTTGESRTTSTESWSGTFSSLTSVVFTLDTPLPISVGDLVVITTVGSGGRWRYNFNGTPGHIFEGAAGTGTIANSMAGHMDGTIRHDVTTYDDGEGPKLVEFDSNGDPQELVSIPADWTSCGGLESAGLAAGDIQAAQNDYVLETEICYDTGVLDTNAEYTVPFVISNLDEEALPPFPTGPNIPPNNLFNSFLDGSDGGDVFSNYEIDSLTLAYVGTATGGDDGIFNVAGLGNTPSYVQDGPGRVLATWEAAPGTVVPSNRSYRLDFTGSHSGNLLVVAPTAGNQITVSGGAAGNEVMGRLIGRVQPNIIETVRTYRDLTGNGPDLVLDAHGNSISVDLSWAEIACLSDDEVNVIEQLIEDDCKLVGNFTEKVFNDTGVVDRFDFNPDPSITLDAATVTLADIEAFFDDFDYSAAPDATSTTNSLDIPDAFTTSANPDANVSFLQGFINVTQATTISLSNTNQWAGRVEVDENCDGNYVTLITHYNGPGVANTSATEPLPEGIIGIRITSFDYDGVNGNIVTNVSNAVALSNVEPNSRCFIGKRLDGETDVIELSTGLVVPGAQFDTCSASAPAVVAAASGPVICEPFDLDISFVDDSAVVTETWTPTALGEYTFDFVGIAFEPDDTVSLQIGTNTVNDVYDGTATPLSFAASSQTGLTLNVTDLVEHTFTLTAAGTTAFNEFFDITIASTSCPVGSLDLSPFRNVATADLVADANHEHDFGGFRQVWNDVGEFEVRAVASGFSDGRAVLVSTADDDSNSAAVRATSSSAANGTEARIALTARDAGFDENSIRVSESGVGIRFNTSGIAGSVFTIEGLPAYADQAAAVAAGAQGTTVYQTDGTGAAPLNVAGILMVVQ